MFSNLNFNSIFYLFLGLLLMLAGGYYAYRMRMYPLGGGLIFLGAGGILCGLTNGFTDYSPTGRMLWKIGVPTLLLGLLMTGYGVLRFI
jgi:hypothetical protein